MTGIFRGRKHTLNVILPRRIRNHSDNELRMMLVTLKNAIVATSVQVMRIENELKQRGVDSRILSSANPKSASYVMEESDVLRWQTRVKEGNMLSA